MEVKCSYCRRKIADSMVICPYCGAENENYNPIFNKEENTSVSAKNPQTIEELKEWYNSMNLPSPEVTRFFIGKDYSGPMAFGIYKSDLTGDYIVYKNKKDRSRTIRYQGPDENYAVNELYLKLKSEIASQKTRNEYASFTSSNSKRKSRSVPSLPIMPIIVIVGVVIFIFSSISSVFGPPRGYYKYHDSYYYRQNSRWYQYDNGWYRASPPRELKKNYSEYYTSEYYSPSYDITDFEYSGYYDSPSSSFWSSSSDYDSSSRSDSSWWDSDSSWDSSSSWDSDSFWDSSDSWDSSSTDWDSDW